MKKIILIAAFAFGTYLVSAQAPEKMSYQAVVRNATGQLIQNQNVGIKASILQNSGTGTVVYSETLSGTTNANGLVSLAIGSGTVLSGTFASIDWSTGNYYLKTETDPTGGTNYTIAGTSQLLSVPYAMYAKSAGKSAYSDKVRFVFQMKVGENQLMEPVNTFYNFGANTATNATTTSGLRSIKLNIAVPGLYHFDVNMVSEKGNHEKDKIMMSYTSDPTVLNKTHYKVYAPFLDDINTQKVASCDKSFDVYFASPQSVYFVMFAPLTSTSFLTINGTKISD